tara:strand:- start:248 stop:1426 length:1179 start_codon:yes stop_codon:yes gene_type:complete
LKKKIKILFIQPISQFSGSLRSLEEYLKLLIKKKKYEFYFLTPLGPSSKTLKKYGKVFSLIGIPKFDNTEIGKYEGFRWLVILREFFYLILFLFTSIKLKKKIKNINIIHSNEITALPTIIILKFFFKCKTVVHVRTILSQKKDFFLKTINNILKKKIDKVITIDSTVQKSLDKKIKSTIIRNIINDVKIYRNRTIKNKKKKLILGYIGSFLKYKGVEDLSKAIATLRIKKFNIKLILTGQFIRKNNTILSKLIKFIGINRDIEESKIINQKDIKVYSKQNNLDKFYNNIDILIFPSYLNALGRQVIEAGFYKKPSIVCLRDSKADCFINNKTGIRFKNKGDVKQLINSIKFFYFNRSKINFMGKNAFKLVNRNYNVKKNLNKLENLYNDLV